MLEAAEVYLLTSYYQQDGDHAAVTGGEGTEALKDVFSTLVMSMPLNADDVLTVDVGISAYSSASTSNISPLDGSNTEVSPFNASSGALPKRCTRICRSVIQDTVQMTETPPGGPKSLFSMNSTTFP